MLSRVLEHTLTFCCSIAAASVSPAFAAHPIPVAERWATITHQGNANYIAPPNNWDFPTEFGRVDHVFQIGRTEITGSEWIDYVRAYAPYMQHGGFSTPFTSESIIPREIATGVYEYTLIPGAVNTPIEVSWHHVARYCNWLHNDKRPEQAAFENGAYDTSTFGRLPNGVITDQLSHSPGARYWIPTLDEWIKAAYFDPNRFGTGVPGYWLQPNASDLTLIPGPPGIGQTSAGWPQATAGWPDVAAYSNTQSPWGLFDLSGGVQEWTESPLIDPARGPTGRWVRGSYISVVDGRGFDHINEFDAQDPLISTGFRLARAVPSPPSCVIGSAFAMLVRRERRNK